MSVKAKEIINIIESIAPKELCCSWDNVGVMAGDSNCEVKKAVIALDCSAAVIDEAVSIGADMIITHHPFIFKAVKNLNFDTPLSVKIAKVIKNDIIVYSAHTNLDIADFGTNYTLAKLLELENVHGLVSMGNDSYMGRYGNLRNELKFGDLIDFVKEKLCAEKLVVNGDMDTAINKVALCTGAGADFEFMAEAKKKGCQAYITGDVGYHDAQIAEDLGMCLIDGTHYLTEVIVVDTLYKILSDKFKEVEFIKSCVNGQTLNIV
ncbi:MAG: Nif3-like dinuclear metal center hexameric protein [Clostridia bacterium]|nr:Nif3-like dinuclear metal center hexameric protein [Clostridia bacterium]